MKEANLTMSRRGDGETKIINSTTLVVDATNEVSRLLDYRLWRTSLKAFTTYGRGGHGSHVIRSVLYF